MFDPDGYADRKRPGYWRRQMAGWAQKNVERHAWEKANPEIAAQWSAAIQEDEERRQMRNRLAWEQGQKDWTEAHLRDCDVPDAVAFMLARDFEQRGALAKVDAFMASKDTFLVLFGEPNTGKTVAACSAFLTLKAPLWTSDAGQTWEWNSKVGLFVSAHDVSSASYFDADAKKRLRRMANVRLLVLDDLGAEMMSESWKSNFDALIDARYGGKRKTILTSNVSARKEKIPGSVGEKVEYRVSPFEERYGARIARRIRERGVVFMAERG